MSSTDRSLLETFDRICLALGISKTNLLGVLQLSEEQFDKIERGHAHFPIESLTHASDTFDVSLRGILSGDIDYGVLARHHGGDDHALPERYSNPEHFLARKRSVMGIMHYIRRLQGQDMVRDILRRVQVKPNHFADPEERMSPYLIKDLFTEAIASGFEQSHLREMGKSALEINKQTRVGAILSRATSPTELYSELHEKIMDRHYDKIFNYRIQSLTKTGIVMETTVNREGHEMLGTPLFGSRGVCLYKQGVYASFLGHIKFQYFNFRERACMYLGDDRCEFELSWPETWGSHHVSH
jgi:hypothetical protein